MQTEDTRAIFTTVFAGSIVLVNALAAKSMCIDLPGLGGVAVPSGFVALGVAYLGSDLLVEYHWKDHAATVVNKTVITFVIAHALTFFAIWMPSAPFYGGQDAFISTLGGSALIILTSVVALAFAKHFDVRLFAKLNDRTAGRHLLLRSCGSTAIRQNAATVVFITLGFAIFPALDLCEDPT